GGGIGVSVDSSPVSTAITDTLDTTTVSLSTANVNEDAASVTFTATLSHAGESDVTVVTDLGNIVITAGNTTGTLVVNTQDSDVYTDPDSITATIIGTPTGGNFENLTIGTGSATAQITDTLDTTTVTLTSATVGPVTEGGSIIYTASVNHPVTGSPLVVTLSNGAVITIPVGQSSADSDPVAVRADDVYEDTDDSLTVTIAGTPTGGNYEQLATAGS